MSRTPGDITARLRAAGCVAAEEEAEELAGAAPDAASLERCVRRREAGEPLAWIVGTQRFGTVELGVDTGVYVPRRQSEELARRAARQLAATGGWAADLCTGAGPVARHLVEATGIRSVVGVDLDPRAAACARRNGVRAVVGDLGAPLRRRSFAVITAVAPYVPSGQLRLLPADARDHEPRHALDGGGDGLEVLRRVVQQAASLLVPEGWLFVEVGAGQDQALSPNLDAFGFAAETTWADEDGDLRGLAAVACRPTFD